MERACLLHTGVWRVESLVGHNPRCFHGPACDGIGTSQKGTQSRRKTIGRALGARFCKDLVGSRDLAHSQLANLHPPSAGPSFAIGDVSFAWVHPRPSTVPPRGHPPTTLPSRFGSRPFTKGPSKDRVDCCPYTVFGGPRCSAEMPPVDPSRSLRRRSRRRCVVCTQARRQFGAMATLRATRTVSGAARSSFCRGRGAPGDTSGPSTTGGKEEAREIAVDRWRTRLRTCAGSCSCFSKGR
eukprot:scaffold2868_cov348-Pavlova_lutheri.AAC.25